MHAVQINAVALMPSQLQLREKLAVQRPELLITNLRSGDCSLLLCLSLDLERERLLSLPLEDLRLSADAERERLLPRDRFSSL
jgi:hypothetical protein